MKTLTISVTRNDIENGMPRSARSCPIALATKRKITDYFTVSQAGLRFNKDYIIPIPERAQDFIANYDSHNFVVTLSAKPFKFKLEVPNSVKIRE